MKRDGDIEWAPWPSINGPLICRMIYVLQSHDGKDGWRTIWGPFYCVMPEADDDEYWYEEELDY